MDIDTRLLRNFAMIAEEGNLTRAAEKLFLAQPSLTKQVKSLEHRLGFELFTRSRTGMILTPAGREFARNVPDLLDLWDSLLRSTREAAGGTDRSLRAGFVASAANEYTQPIISAFTRLRPGWRVDLRQTEWYDPTAGLAAGEVDVALLRLPFPGQDDLRYEVLITEPRWIALPANHRLADRETIAFQELLDEPFVATPPESGWWREYWLASDERGGRPVRVGGVARNPDEWLAAIASGYGISLTPAATARFYRRPDVVYRPVTGVSPSQVAVAWRPAGQQSAAVEDFISSCLAVRDRNKTGDVPEVTDSDFA
ncbi:LysR family transcriptional regulator [Streptomyces sp. H27-C3]|uniref:LysR family transcriptional regulator n=1 Tax=Streptomyces sp. H27-C3 TaxID=3046305 RepID=UPI0024BB4BF7|nr:LysR family transcriptional regulator [Streptomyces sp. H27-C3]MDJ0466587.1 LysR family transcriptional regulator [Streptomyces sp. H27-C3]